MQGAIYSITIKGKNIAILWIYGRDVAFIGNSIVMSSL